MTDQFDVKLAQAKDYLRSRNIYATERGNSFTYYPSIKTDIRADNRADAQNPVRAQPSGVQ